MVHLPLSNFFVQLIWIWILNHYHILTMRLFFYFNFAANSRNKITHFFTFSVSSKVYAITQFRCHCEKVEFMLCRLLFSFSSYLAVLIYWNGQLLKSPDFFSKDFIYLFMRDTERDRDTGRGRSRLRTGSRMQDLIPGPQDHALS